MRTIHRRACKRQGKTAMICRAPLSLLGCILACAATAGEYAAARPDPSPPRVVEALGRGVVAQSRGKDVFISWRLLGTEPQDTAFNVYRSESGSAFAKLNDAPLSGGTCFIDAKADLAHDNAYVVRAVVGGVEASAPGVPFVLRAGTPAHAPLEVPLVPREHAQVHFAWVGDLTGDGEYDFIVDRHPGKDPDTNATQKVEAYTRDGRHLWTLDLGPQSRNTKGSRWNAGAATISNGHNDGLTVYDFDLDGRAEVALKTARGVVFGDGRRIDEGDDVFQHVVIRTVFVFEHCRTCIEEIALRGACRKNLSHFHQISYASMRIGRDIVNGFAHEHLNKCASQIYIFHSFSVSGIIPVFFYFNAFHIQNDAVLS